jgi:hypothetical protein
MAAIARPNAKSGSGFCCAIWALSVDIEGEVKEAEEEDDKGGEGGDEVEEEVEEDGFVSAEGFEVEGASG